MFNIDDSSRAGWLRPEIEGLRGSVPSQSRTAKLAAASGRPHRLVTMPVDRPQQVLPPGSSQQAGSSSSSKHQQLHLRPSRPIDDNLIHEHDLSHLDTDTTTAASAGWLHTL